MTGAVVRLADELFETVLLVAEPVTATVLGFHEVDDGLTDYTEAGDELVRGRVRDVAARAAALEPDALDPEDRVTRAVVLYQADAMLSRLAARSVEWAITDLWPGTVTDLLALLGEVSVAEPAHADGYLSRLASLPAALAAIADRHRAGVAAGRPPVRRQVDAMVAYLDTYLADPADDPLRGPVPPEGSAVDTRAFVARRDWLLDEAVRPALVGYRNTLAEQIAPHGRPPDRAGLCWMAGGEESYAGLVRVHTTTDHAPEALHRTGLDSVAELRAEAGALGRAVFGTDGLAHVFERLRGDPEMRWRDGAEVLHAARTTVERAEHVLPQWFATLPGHRCAVAEMPAGTAPTAPPSYQAPATDGSRPGTYFVNTCGADQRQRFLNDVNAFHEAVPGHHLQLALAQQATALPRLRRVLPVNAYAEGWALYAERLADEMGLYSGPLARLGMVTLDLLRAARLVVDTGLHAHGWGRDRALEYLLANVPMAPVEFETQVDQYLTAPGQALGYLVGKLELQRLRAHAADALGDRFDLRSFHDAVLGHGQLPLSALTEVVSTWIDERITGPKG